MNFVDMMVMVADRVNAFTFKQLPDGSAVRIGGRLSAASDEKVQLTTTDGGVLTVTGCTIKSMQESSLQWWQEDFGLNAGFNAGFVEIVGQKMSDSVVSAASLWPLGENVDHPLWEYALESDTINGDRTSVVNEDVDLGPWRLPAEHLSLMQAGGDGTYTSPDDDADLGALENALRRTHLSQPTRPFDYACAAPAA